MNTRTRIAGLILTAIATTTPAAAGASDTAPQPDVGLQFLTAFDGTVVQIAGSAPNYRLVQRTGAGAFVPVPGAPEALYPRSISGMTARAGSSSPTSAARTSATARRIPTTSRVTASRTSTSRRSAAR